VSASNDHFDVVIVGGRCSGSPLATFLRRAGLSVCVLDRAEFPSDTLSSHFFQVSGLSIMKKLGVLDRVHATGAPSMTRVYMKFDDVDLSGDVRLRPDDPSTPIVCVRRVSLDVLLVDNARSAGVELRTGSRVTGLIHRNGRVAGVKVENGSGRKSAIHADLVVGADGRLSSVGRMVGARRYHVAPNERFNSWAYFRNVPLESPPTCYFHRRGDDFVIAGPADDGLFIVIVAPSLGSLDAYRADSERWFKNIVAGCEPVAQLLANAERASKFRGLTRFEGFFREASGPGWVLTGDAGHFKDPGPGQGISDALRQAEALSQAIVRGMGSAPRLDRELRRWWRWRDRDAFQHYWFAFDVGRAGPISPVRLEIMRQLARDDETRKDFIDLFIHRAFPSDVFSSFRVSRALFKLMSDQQMRRGALADAVTIVREELRRRFSTWWPSYDGNDAVDEAHTDHQPSPAQ
jgi:flavin-dependent dehydrogenase